MNKIQGKFSYNKGELEYTPYCHALHIKSDYDITVRGIVYQKEKIIYIRINDLSVYQGLEYKKIDYNFNKNLQECISHFKRNYTGYKIYTSYTINKLSYELKQEVLSC